MLKYSFNCHRINCSCNYYWHKSSTAPNRCLKAEGLPCNLIYGSCEIEHVCRTCMRPFICLSQFLVRVRWQEWCHLFLYNHMKWDYLFPPIFCHFWWRMLFLNTIFGLLKAFGCIYSGCYHIAFFCVVSGKHLQCGGMHCMSSKWLRKQSLDIFLMFLTQIIAHWLDVKCLRNNEDHHTK